MVLSLNNLAIQKLATTKKNPIRPSWSAPTSQSSGVRVAQIKTMSASKPRRAMSTKYIDGTITQPNTGHETNAARHDHGKGGRFLTAAASHAP